MAFELVEICNPDNARWTCSATDVHAAILEAYDSLHIDVHNAFSQRFKRLLRSKLRRGDSINLLPGRVVALRLDPLTTAELGEKNLDGLLLYGSLPAIHSVVQDRDKDTDLASYVTTYKTHSSISE